MARIMVVEDEHTLLSALEYTLEREGYSVVAVDDGLDALRRARETPPDLVILDLLLPGLHGLEVCRSLRKLSDVPIMILTAKTEDVDKVVGLELGADDYMTKPFSMKELIARVRAHLRRALEPWAVAAHDLLTDGDLVVDLTKREVRKNDRPVALKPKEMDLLVFLMRNPGRAYSRGQLLEHVWGYEAFGRTRTVDVHISELRQKIEDDPANPVRLLTVRGIGYRYSG